MLANATMLEKMKISPAFWLQYADTDLEKVKEKILLFFHIIVYQLNIIICFSHYQGVTTYKRNHMSNKIIM